MIIGFTQKEAQHALLLTCCAAYNDLYTKNQMFNKLIINFRISWILIFRIFLVLIQEPKAPMQQLTSRSSMG